MQLKIVRLLLERNASVDQRNGAHLTPLAIVCLTSYRARDGAKHGRPMNVMPLIELLLEYKADPKAMVGIDPCEPLVGIVLRNEDKDVIPEVVEFFRQFA